MVYDAAGWYSEVITGSGKEYNMGFIIAVLVVVILVIVITKLV